MITIQLPNREPVVMAPHRAERLYAVLWENAVDVRGSVSAAARVKEATALPSRLREPLKFYGAEADAIATALLAMHARGIG